VAQKPQTAAQTKEATTMTPNNPARPGRALALATAVAALSAPAVALAGSQGDVVDLRSPDTVEASDNARSQVVDARSPDTIDAALSPAPALLGQPGGFDWEDAGIGAGLATTLLTLLAGSTLFWLRRHPRRQVQAT
jgi:hypothetical protein